MKITEDLLTTTKNDTTRNEKNIENTANEMIHLLRLVLEKNRIFFGRWIIAHSDPAPRTTAPLLVQRPCASHNDPTPRTTTPAPPDGPPPHAFPA